MNRIVNFFQPEKTPDAAGKAALGQSAGLDQSAGLGNSAPVGQSAVKASVGQLQFNAGEDGLSFFAPLHYERNYAYPLLVWLHGPGDNERQLKRIMPLVSLRNYVGLALRGTRLPNPVSRGGRAPGNWAGAGFGWPQSEANVAVGEQAILDGIQLACARYRIARHRVFLAGFDCGGTMAFRVAMRHPEQFAGVLSLCGAFPVGRQSLSRLQAARRVPLLMAVGRDSQRYPAPHVCRDLRLLHSAGMHLTLRQYPCGHEISPWMLSDMDRWMMEHIQGPVVERHNGDT